MLPSEIKLESYRGYRNQIFAGWKKLDDATIVGDGYTAVFYRLSERTIDDFCDALNGWHNTWTRFLLEYADENGTLSVVINNPEEADRIYSILATVTPMEFEHEESMTAADVARNKLEAIINMLEKAS